MVIRKILRKARNKCAYAVGSILAGIFGTGMSDARFMNEAWDFKYRFKNSEGIESYFRSRKYPECFIDLSKKESITSAVREYFPHAREKIITEADKICGHIYNLLGSGDKSLGEDIDWHVDFKTGYRWSPRKYYTHRGSARGKADLKVPWELSRCQHFTTLGQAYWLTGDEKYAREFISQVSDWIEKNPPRFGVNWRCTMDVAIRAVNWVSGYCFFEGSREMTGGFLLKFLKSLLIHGRHISKNLEYGPVTTNHYLSNIAGLACLAIMFPEFNESKKWLDFSKDELEKEILKQVYPDGMDFEASTCYHRLALELFFYPALLGRRNGVLFSRVYMERLRKMFDFALYAVKPNGRMPQVGDNDSGRFLKFEIPGTEVLDMRYLFPVAAVFLDEPFYNVNFGSGPDYGLPVLCLFGKEGFNRWRKMGRRPLSSIGSRAFNDSGIYIMRNGRDYMIISCGPNGQDGNGGHAHNDKLSFELCIDGKDVLIDPGTYVYTPKPELRNRFRSTAYHNTVSVDGEEQNRLIDSAIFAMENDAMARCVKWESNEEYDLFVGEHYGYERLSNPVVHRREIRYYKKQGRWKITDRFEGEGEHSFEWNLIFSPDFKEELRIHSGPLQWHKETAFYSREYGVINESQKLLAVLKARVPFEVSFSIEK